MYDCALYRVGNIFPSIFERKLGNKVPSFTPVTFLVWLMSCQILINRPCMHKGMSGNYFIAGNFIF